MPKRSNCGLFDKDKETRLEMPSRRGSVFYGFVPDVKAGQRYGFRVYGRENAEYGSCFNPNKLLIDPYSKKIDGKPSYRTAEEMAWFRPEDETRQCRRCTEKRRDRTQPI